MILTSVEAEGHEPIGSDPHFYWTDVFEIVQCQGCDSLSFRKLHTNSEDFGQVGPHDDDVDYLTTEELFPYGEHTRAPISDESLLPFEVRGIYAETIRALNGSQPILAGIGIRAIIETICREKEAAGENLLARIDNLVSKGVLTPEGAGILHRLRVLGNKAAHEVKPHRPDQLKLSLDVVEHLLVGVYVLPQQAKRTFRDLPESQSG